MVSNIETNQPIPDGTLKAGAISAAGTVVGGVIGQKGAEALTKSTILGGQGTLSTAGKVTAEVGTTLIQEAVTQGTAGATNQIENKPEIEKK